MDLVWIGPSGVEGLAAVAFIRVSAGLAEQPRPGEPPTTKSCA